MILLVIALAILAVFASSLRTIALSSATTLAVLAAIIAAHQLQSKGQSDGARGADARVANIVEAAMDPIVTVDETQRVVVFNAAAEQVFGHPRDAVIGRSLDMLIPEPVRAAHRRHIERFGATGVTARRMGASLLTGLRANGEVFPIEASIAQHNNDGRKFYTAIVRDVSDRGRAATLLERSEARLRGILDSAMDAIITTDETQRIVLFNNAAESMFGYSRDEALGAPLAMVIPERFRHAHEQHVAGFGQTGTTSRRMGGSSRIVKGLRRSGEEFPIDASISQVLEDGKRYYTVILRDVTSRVEAEEALRRSKDELQELGAAAHLTREQEKSRIARELHDELGQLLTMLQMDVAWCKERQPTNNAAFVAKLDRMETLLKSTIAATRRIASDLRPLMLDDLGLVPSLEWLVENFSQRTNIACELSIAEGDLGLTTPQATAIFRIVQESLTNIAKHAHAKHADITIEREDAALVVRVEDDGCGFAMDAPRKPQSFGLFGLRERASLIGAQVTVTSAPSQGTTVELRVPQRSEVELA
jgi:PAS domain S-box-containing protein